MSALPTLLGIVMERRDGKTERRIGNIMRSMGFEKTNMRHGRVEHTYWARGNADERMKDIELTINVTEGEHF
jgi:hypothetical protein